MRDPDTGETERVVVTAEGDQGYAAHESQVGTKTDTPLIEVPQSVQVVDSQLIEDRRITTLQGALNNVSGVSDTGSRGQFDSYSIRGFNAFATAYLDGLKVERGNSWFEQEVSMLERVEVLKGPGSVLFGQGSLGGIVNEVSRRPPGTRIFNVDVTFGSYDYYEVRADVGGPLNQSGSVRARFDGLYRNRGDFVDYGGRERIYLTPSLSWDIGPQTTVTFIANYTGDEVFPYEGIPAVGSVLYHPNGEIPRSRYDGEPSLDRFPIARGYLESLFEHISATSGRCVRTRASPCPASTTAGCSSMISPRTTARSRAPTRRTSTTRIVRSPWTRTWRATSAPGASSTRSWPAWTSWRSA